MLTASPRKDSKVRNYWVVNNKRRTKRDEAKRIEKKGKKIRIRNQKKMFDKDINEIFVRSLLSMLIERKPTINFYVTKRKIVLDLVPNGVQVKVVK